MSADRLLFFKKHNLAEAQNHTLCMSILVLYPRFSQGEWVAPLVHFLLKLDSMVGGGALDQQRIIITHGFFLK